MQLVTHLRVNVHM